MTKKLSSPNNSRNIWPIRIGKLAIVVISILIGVNYKLHATDYYISSSTGNDSNNGLSSSTAWQTISKLNSMMSVLTPGDRVLFKKGDTFTGSIIVDQSGAPGNPIEYSAYGSGEAPILDGRQSLNSWTNLGGNIWESSETIASRPTALTMNENLKALGRSPNSGYWNIDSGAGNTQISANELSVGNWVDAEIVVRTRRWVLDKRPITNHSGSQVTFDAVPNDIWDDYGFFIQNHPGTLDQDGEWCYTTSGKIRLYSNTDPSSRNVKVSITDHAFNINRASHLNIKELAFIGFQVAVINLINVTNCTIESCSFEKSGRYDIEIGGLFNPNNLADHITIKNNSFSNTQGSCIVGGGANYAITGNTFRNIGLVPGMGESGNRYMGMYILSDGLLIEKNTFEEIGYLPMNLVWSDNLTISKNFINRFCKILDDGAGIYVYTGETGHNPLNREISDNIVLNGLGEPNGTPQTYSAANGIYLDDASANVIIQRNTVAHMPLHGIYFHNAPDNSAFDNTIYDCENPIRFQVDRINDAVVKGNTIERNIAVILQDDQRLFSYNNYRDIDGALKFERLKDIGILNNNYYCKPFPGSDDNSFNGLDNNGRNKTYNLDTWRTATGFDVGSSLSPTPPFDPFNQAQDIRFEYNANDANKTIISDKNYLTPDGNTYSTGDNIVIPPFASVVLLSDPSGGGIPTTGISVDPLNLTLEEGETSQLTATIAPINATDQTVSWVSSDPSIATVDANGLVNAIAVGNVSITVSSNDGGFTDTTTVTVNAGSSSLIFEEQDGFLEIEAEDLTLTENWIKGNTIPGASGGQYIYWDGNQYFNDASNGLINVEIIINNPGVYRFNWNVAVGNGTNGTEHNDTWLKVNADDFYAFKEADNRYIHPIPLCNTSSFHCPEGSSIDGFFKNYGGGVEEFRWQARTNDSDPHLIYVKFDEAKTYSFTIAARSSYHCIDVMTFTKDENISIDVPVSGISVNPSNLNLEEGETSQLTATIAPINATDQTVSWVSSDPSIATVDANGLVTAIAVGSTSITVTSNDGRFTASVTINVFRSMEVTVYNQISPNGDGIQDTWQIDNLVEYTDCQIKVYTRAGKLVYQSQGYASPWDGTENGSVLPAGVYYYTIRLNSRKSDLSGYVTLIH